MTLRTQILFYLICFQTLSLQAQVVGVGTGPVTNYPTVQAAVNATSPGDEVRLSTGRFFETLFFTNKSICISGGWKNQPDHKSNQWTLGP